MFGSIVTSPLSSLSPKQAVCLANVYLEGACNINDRDVALVLCHNTEVALSKAKKAARRKEDKAIVEDIAIAYIDLGKQLEERGHGREAQVSYKKAEKLGVLQGRNRASKSSRPNAIVKPLKGPSLITEDLRPTDVPIHPPKDLHQQQHCDVEVPKHIFAENVRLPTVDFRFPEADERLNSTPQLANCLSILQAAYSVEETLEPAAHKWLQAIEKDSDEQERLRTMATDVVRVFKRDELKDAKAVAEVVVLSPVLPKDAFHDLLREFYSGIDHSGLLNVHHLVGLAQLIQGAHPGFLDADDLIKVLDLLSKRLRDTHNQSTTHIHQLTLAVSNVLDAMADTKVTGLDREKLHEPLSDYLGSLSNSSDPYLVYQAAYAYQALLCVPDNETKWQATLRRTGKVFQGASGLVSAVKGIELNKFIEGLEDIQEGLSGVSKVVEAVTAAYESVSSLAEGGKGFLDCLKEELSFDRKRDWYSALRGTDTLLRDGNLALFKELVYKAPCRLDLAFQWGVCQRLGEIAANSMWDADIRQGAIGFLGDIYRDDDIWGQQTSVKQWIVNILMQLSRPSGTGLQLHAISAEALLQELETNGDIRKQALYRACRENGPISYPSNITQTELASPSLLDRVQNRPDVEGNIRLLKKQRSKARGNAVYIPPQAKSSLQAADDTRFLLLERVKEFLESNQKVFLLLGDSGSGKSTFSRELEIDLWQSYKAKSGRIPLHINLPAIDKPEHDMIPKQLRKNEFTETQIREMKHYRKFILICDGYDESQQMHNLYMSNRLNQPGEWDVQMVISCRSEYLGVDYRDRFQPRDHNQQSDSSLIQEAVVTPFSPDQVQAYIQQYISVHQPLWQLEDYRQALEQIPTLKELVRNPFLMSLSLEVLPRMVDPGQNLSVTQITRVGLYDHFVEQWLEREKKRIGEKELAPQTRVIFERLNDEGFTHNGIGFLKKLAVAIYKEQGGQPMVEYSQTTDEGSWKDVFFLHEDKQLLREACPLTRNGNQHRFIHRSLLEYALARAIFDPQDGRKRALSDPVVGRRRGSTNSILSFELDRTQESIIDVHQGPDVSSPLVWRSFVNDYSLLQFLEERVKQEPLFMEQLLAYVEHSKQDKKWRTAAANAMTILVRAGVQFNSAHLQGIRIPGADLSYGVFDSANLQDADLRKVNFRGAWLRQTDLSRAQMTGVQFGELPFLSQDTEALSCEYSPDGKSFVVALGSGDINMYTTSSWERTQTLIGHSDAVRWITCSPNGKQIASASDDRTIRLWNSETGLLQHLLSGHDDQVVCVGYSPQGDQVASASRDGTMRFWEVTTGDCCQTVLFDDDGLAMCVVYSPKDQQFASGHLDSVVRLWSLGSEDCNFILIGHTDIVWAVGFSPQGDQVASASNDTSVRLWDVRTGACNHILTGHSERVLSVAYSPSGDRIATGSMDQTVRLWDVDTGLCVHPLNGHTDSVMRVVYSPKGDQLASSSWDNAVRLWDVLAATSRSVSSGHSAEVNSVEYSPKGDQFASGSMDNAIRLWDMEKGSCLHTLRGHTSTIFSLVYSPEGDRIASGSGDGTIRLWDVETGTCLFVMPGRHEGNVECVAYSPQGDKVASAGGGMTIRLWDATTGEDLEALLGHSAEVTGIEYSPSGCQIASASRDATVRIWDAETGECCRILIGHTNWVRNVVYSPQGNELASASYDKTIRLWDMETGESRLTLIGHSDRVKAITYSQQGNLLASSSWDNTIRLWDVATGQCRAEMRGLPRVAHDIDWITASATNYLMAGVGDGSILRWEVIEQEDVCSVRLQWSATSGIVTVTDALVQDVRGLTSFNKQLLRQRGAIGEPERLLREASKKLMSMASVVSKSKRPSDGPVLDSSASKFSGSAS